MGGFGAQAVLVAAGGGDLVAHLDGGLGLLLDVGVADAVVVGDDLAAGQGAQGVEVVMVAAGGSEGPAHCCRSAFWGLTKPLTKDYYMRR